MLMIKLGKSNKASQLFLFFQNMFIIGIIKSQLDVLDNLNESILGGRSQRKGGGTGIKSAMRRLVAVLQDRSEVSSLFSGGQIEAAALVELHVPHTAHGLNLRLEGAKLVVVSVVAALKQILVSSVAGVLVSHPTSKRGRESFRMCTRWDIIAVRLDLLLTLHRGPSRCPLCRRSHAPTGLARHPPGSPSCCP